MKLIDYSDFIYRPAVWGIIFNSDNKVLLVQSYFFKKDEWGLVGGGVERGETEAEALNREIKEECGTDKFKIIYEYPEYITYDWTEEVIRKRFYDTQRKFKGQTRRVFVVKFLGETKDLKFQRSEIKAHKWVDVEDLESYLLFKGQYQNIKAILDSYQEVAEKA